MFTEIVSQLPPSTVLLLSTVVLGLLTYHLLRSLRTPGPWGVPLLGYYPFLKRDIHLQFQELTKKCGEVYSINICGVEHFHLSSMRAHKEVHFNQTDNFVDRPADNFAVQIFGNGIIGLVGDAWRHQKKHFLQSLRDIGLSASKDNLRGPVEEAVQYSLQALRKSRGKVIDLIPLLTRACTDAVVKLYLGSDVSDEVIAKLNRNFIDMMEPISNCNILLTGQMANWFIVPWIHGYSKVMSNINSLNASLQKIVDDHTSTFDIDQPSRDFIDRYILERKMREKKNDPSAKYFTDASLVGTLVQVYGDGSSSIGIFVGSFLRDLSAHTDVQDKIHEEILQVVGSERLPNLEDKPKLPLLSSTLKELLRTSCLFPVLPGLKCIKDTTVMGVKIPKGAVTILDMFAANHDPKAFENPNSFDATRFLSEKNKVEQPINFGMGRRSCAGEGLVLAELFLFMSAVLQNFLILPAEDDLTKDDLLKYDKYNVLIVPRSRGRFNSATGNA